MLQISSALRGPVESAVASCRFPSSIEAVERSIVLGVPYKGFLNSPTPTGEVIVKSAD
jgi:hypothetical protein